MRRREFVTLIGGAAAAWPLVARAQQTEQMRRIGALINRAVDDPEGQARLAALKQGLEQLGWSDGRNVRIEARWGEDDAERERKYTAELVALSPDVIVAGGSLVVTSLQRVTSTIPIVFAAVGDPVGAGLVDTLARPGGNTTGFMLLEYSLSGKWLELLKQIAPGLTRAVVLRRANVPSGSAEFAAIQSISQSLGVEVSPVSLRDTGDMERVATAFPRSASGGLIVTPSASAWVHRDLIIAFAAQHKLPAVYAYRANVTAGGLISYGLDSVDQFRQAAGYVDRILKGEKPADLPVQAPTKYELAINLKTAKALGLTVPSSLVSTADDCLSFRNFARN
jgi:putative tryptophan/tyrosine transport system substrate-binding protein